LSQNIAVMRGPNEAFERRGQGTNDAAGPPHAADSCKISASLPKKWLPSIGG
jgi:hypothetical protein